MVAVGGNHCHVHSASRRHARPRSMARDGGEGMRLVSSATEGSRAGTRFRARRALARAALAVPRTIRFVARTVTSGQVA